MKSEIPAPAIIAAVVVILLVIGFFGWRALTTEPTQTNVGSDGVKVKATAPPSAPGGPTMTPGKAVDGQTMQPAN